MYCQFLLKQPHILFIPRTYIYPLWCSISKYITPHVFIIFNLSNIVFLLFCAIYTLNAYCLPNWLFQCDNNKQILASSRLWRSTLMRNLRSISVENGNYICANAGLLSSQQSEAPSLRWALALCIKITIQRKGRYIMKATERESRRVWNLQISLGLVAAHV